MGGWGSGGIAPNLLFLSLAAHFECPNCRPFIVLPSRRRPVNLPAWRGDSFLFLQFAACQNRTCRFWCCTYARRSLNRSLPPRPSVSSTRDKFACRPPPHNCIHRHAWQPRVVHSNVRVTGKPRRETEALACAAHPLVVLIRVHRKNVIKFSILKNNKTEELTPHTHTFDEVQMGTAASTGVKCPECCHSSRRLRIPKVWKTWGRELRGKYRGYQIPARGSHLAALEQYSCSHAFTCSAARYQGTAAEVTEQIKQRNLPLPSAQANATESFAL